MKRIALFTLVLFVLPLVVADSITLHSPKEGEMVDPWNEGFTFGAEGEASTTIVKTCSLLIDGEVMKTLGVGIALQSEVRRYKAETSDGPHTWSVSCQPEDESLDPLVSNTQNFIAENAVQADVTASSSGVTRGSMEYAFEVMNSPEQEPITIKEVLPGDFLEATVKIPPSTYTREIYVKSKRSSSETDVYYELDFEGTVYQVRKGQNTELDLDGVTLYISLVEFEGSKATFVVFSSSNLVDPAELEETPDVELNETETNQTNETIVPDVPVNETVDVPVNDTELPEEVPEPVVNETEEQPEEPAEEPQEEETPAEPEEDEPGFFSRIFGWFTGLFGR